MQISTRPIALLDIAKLALYGIFLNYYCYFILRGSFIPMGTQIFFAVAVACVVTTIFGEKIYIGSEIKCWIAYIILSLLTVLFAVNVQQALDGLGKYIQRLIYIMMIAYICEREKSVKFAVRLLAVTAFACAVSCLIMNVDVGKKLTLESGANISTNDIGSIMAFGCFAILFAFGLKEHKGLIKSAVKIGYIIAAASVIFVAGSRKSILAIIILFVLIFLLCAKDYFRNLSITWIILISLLLIAAAIIVYQYLMPMAEDTNLYVRVYGRGAERTADSDDSRMELYRQALTDFINNPVFGLGFNGFDAVHKNYTHSTYVEPLACSGIIGFLYLAPYVMILVKQIKLIKLNQSNIEERIWQKELLAFYISFLFVGIGIPYMYKDIPCIILAMFIASQRISFDKLKENATEAVAEGDTSEPITNKGITSYS